MTNIMNCTARLGESPVWDDRVSMFYWLDYEVPKIFSASPDGVETSQCELELPTPLGGLVLSENPGEFFIFCRQTVYLVDLKSGGRVVSTWPLPVGEDLCVNDVTVDRLGRLWLSFSHCEESLPIGGLCLVEPGSVRWLKGDVVIANGPAVSKDGTIAYFSDSEAKVVYKFWLNDTSHEWECERFIQLGEHEGFPDGVRLDDDGGLWLAHYDGARISRWSKEGERLKDILFKPSKITALAFGGKNYKTILITTASEMQRPDSSPKPRGAPMLLSIATCGTPSSLITRSQIQNSLGHL